MRQQYQLRYNEGRMGDPLTLSDHGLFGRFPFRRRSNFYRAALSSSRRDRSMFGRNDNNDKALQKSVTQRLQRASSQAGLSATVQNGSVTLTGKLHFENQRSPIVKAMRSVAGIRSVIDQMVSPPKIRPMHAQNNYRPPAETVDSAAAEPLAIFDPDAASPAPEISEPPAGSLN
jgi:hypothetical protein